MPTLTPAEPQVEKQPAATPPRSRALLALSAALPVVLLALLITFFFKSGGGLPFGPPPAPIESVEFERVVLTPGMIKAHVINTGPEDVTIAQVQVGWTNRASWEFSVEPGDTIPRLGRAVVSIPYPWVEGEPYEIALLTPNSIVFTHEIAVATATPTAGPEVMWTLALLGIYVGVIPVFLGIGWLPFLKALPKHWYGFLLSLTSGLLVFLGVDAIHEALENAERVPGPFQGVAVIVIGFFLSVMGLYAVSGWLKQKRASLGDSTALMLAYSIAFGIGLHNLGEGLAIGGAYALGEVGMGAMLILGFTIHNLTEGVAVVAPIVQNEFRWARLIALGAIAGLPTIAGTMIGAFAYTPVWAVLFLAIGAGAVFQVVIELTRYQIREGGFPALTNAYNFAGFIVGMGIMYVTGMFVTA